MARHSFIPATRPPPLFHLTPGSNFYSVLGGDNTVPTILILSHRQRNVDNVRHNLCSNISPHPNLGSLFIWRNVRSVAHFPSDLFRYISMNSVRSKGSTPHTYHSCPFLFIFPSFSINTQTLCVIYTISSLPSHATPLLDSSGRFRFSSLTFCSFHVSSLETPARRSHVSLRDLLGFLILNSSLIFFALHRTVPLQSKFEYVELI